MTQGTTKKELKRDEDWLKEFKQQRKEEEENIRLYDFLESSLLWYDLNEFNANFHVVFVSSIVVSYL